jgi:hypothetical protein
MSAEADETECQAQGQRWGLKVKSGHGEFMALFAQTHRFYCLLSLKEHKVYPRAVIIFLSVLCTRFFLLIMLSSAKFISNKTFPLSPNALTM